MFGLMKLQPDDEHNAKGSDVFSRCRLCAALAKTNHSSAARIYVNYDVAFFARLIAGLKHSPLAESTCNCRQRCSCRETDTNNPVMRWAVATNILLARLKANDASTDHEGWWWRLASWHLARVVKRPEFQRDTAGWNIPELIALASEQQHREASITEKLQHLSATDALGYLAEQTASITARVVGYGAHLVNPAACDQVSQIGSSFARIAYLVDALEDYCLDYRKGQFNAVRAVYQLDSQTIPEQVFLEVRNFIRTERNELVRLISILPMLEDQRNALIDTFDLNLQHKLDWLAKIQHYATAMKSHLTFSERLARARHYFQKIKPRGFKPSPGFMLGTIGATGAAAIMFARVRYGVDGDALLSGSLDAPLYGVWFAAMGSVGKDTYQSRAKDDRCVDACCCCGWIAPDCCMFGDDCCPWCR